MTTATTNLSKWTDRGFKIRFNKLKVGESFSYFEGDNLPKFIHDETYYLYLKRLAIFFQIKTGENNFQYFIKKISGKE